MRATKSLLRSNPPLTVTIEHDRGPDEGFSQISGSVADSSGAIVPGATITLHGPAVSAPHVATTGPDGRFILSAIPPGHYELQVSSPGFQSASQPIDLQPRDLALLTSALRPGAVSQAVQVTGANVGILTTSAELTEVIRSPLPSKLPATTTVVSGDRMLALDSAGTLFLTHNAGKHWKRIKPEWPGTIAQLALADHPPQDEPRREKKILNAAPLFQLTTTTGDVWLSADGVHWRTR
ncbi:MAG: carboxypeptidase-like regulatory domain-containing protein [Acidobacteriaceae bacterium]